MNIVIYSSNKQTPKLNLNNLSNKRVIKIYLLSDQKLLLNFLNRKQVSIVFLEHELLTGQLRVLIKKIRISHPYIHIVVSTDKKYALDSWKMDLSGFYIYPLTGLHVKSSIQKYLNNDAGLKRTRELSIKTKEGVHSIKIGRLKYLFADGNTTYIHTVGENIYAVNRNLGTFEFLCEENVAFRRVHRSLILNFGNIFKLEQNCIRFLIDESNVKISKSLANKVKRIMLGKE